MSTKKPKGTTFAVMFRHSAPNSLLTETDHERAKTLGLKYIVAQRLSENSTIRVKLVGNRRPQTVDIHDADHASDTFLRAVHAALDIIHNEDLTVPTSVKQALA